MCRPIAGLDDWRPWVCDPLLDGNCTAHRVWSHPGALPAETHCLLSSWFVAHSALTWAVHQLLCIAALRLPYAASLLCSGEVQPGGHRAAVGPGIPSRRRSPAGSEPGQALPHDGPGGALSFLLQWPSSLSLGLVSSSYCTLLIAVSGWVVT